jgi:hypothetical protein
MWSGGSIPCPEVKAVLEAQFDGLPVNEPNLSHWRLGGYGDWLREEQSRDLMRRFNQDGIELRRTAGDQFADQLAVCVAARLSMTARETLSSASDPDAQLQVLRQLCRVVATLRRGDHNAERLKIEREKLGLKQRRSA